MSEICKYYVTYPSSEGNSTQEMDLEDDVPLTQLIPDILTLLDRTDSVPKPEVYIMNELENTERLPYVISFKPKPEKPAYVVTGADVNKCLRDFGHTEYTYLIIESSEIEVGAPAFSRPPGGAAPPPQAVKPSNPPAPESRSGGARLTTPTSPSVAGVRPEPGGAASPTLPLVHAPSARAPKPGGRQAIFQMRVESDVEQLRQELGSAGGMVTGLTLHMSPGKADLKFDLHVRCQVENRRGQLAWREVHPIIFRFEYGYPVKLLSLWYDVAATAAAPADQVVAYAPNVGSIREEVGAPEPGFICLWNTEAMENTGTRIPLQFAIYLLVEQLNYRRVNLENEHGRLNPFATKERRKGGLLPLGGPRLPVVNLLSDREITSHIGINV